MRRTCTRKIARHISFEPARQAWGLDANLEMKAAFPLLHDGNLLPKMIRNLHDYQGRREFDGNHTLPVLPAKSSEGSSPHAWSQWDLTLNPNLLTDLAALQPTPQYVGPRTGYLFASIGWRSAGTSFKFTRSWGESRNWRPGEWAERNITPKWKLVPRIAAIHPDSRFQGKLQFVDVKLSEIVWAIDTKQLNPNEVLTLNILVANGVIPEHDVVWPGVNLVYDLTSELRYPIHVELQNADDRAIAAIEEAGGTFTGTYMSIDGLYQEMRPEEFPVFSDQHLPDRPGFMHVASNPRVRGFLSQWHEEEGKYAHPGAGRRLSHYRRPPHARDFPATFEEYERVKHQQKWHLGQPGTGTVLPFVPSRAYEAHRPAVQRITESPA